MQAKTRPNKILIIKSAKIHTGPKFVKANFIKPPFEECAAGPLKARVTGPILGKFLLNQVFFWSSDCVRWVLTDLLPSLWDDQPLFLYFWGRKV